MVILKRILPLFIASLLTSCYETFTPDIDTTPVLCINSLITAGKSIDVRVSRTWLYTDDSTTDHSVDDAEIFIYVNGALESPDYIPREGDTIKVIAQSNTYGSAEAEVCVPYFVPAKSLKSNSVLINSWRTENDDSTETISVDFNLHVDMEIADPASTKNYYQLSILGYNKSSDYTDDFGASPNLPEISFNFGSLKYEAEPIFTEHIDVFESIMGNADCSGFTFFTDRQFSGKTYTLHLAFENGSYFLRTDKSDPEMFDCGLILTLHTISKSYYNWINYLWHRDEGLIGELGDVGFGDPMWGYSNVSTGAGIVAAQSYATYTVSLNDFMTSAVADASK